MLSGHGVEYFMHSVHKSEIFSVNYPRQNFRKALLIE